MQRKTQTLSYWQEEFQLSQKDVETIYNKILEEARVVILNEISQELVQKYYEAEEKELLKLQDGRLYQPNEQFEVGERIIFPTLEYASGTIEQVRPGNHPQYEQFEVVEVLFEENGQRREFVASFDFDHMLNRSQTGSAAGDTQGQLTPQEVYQRFRKTINQKVKSTLKENSDFVLFRDEIFLKDLLTEFNEGLYNLADAAIDFSGGPLDIDSLIEEIQIANNGITDVLRFSVNYRLLEDSRFVDVGPTGQVLWYLHRLQPTEALEKPIFLRTEETKYDIELFDADLQEILAEIDDEATDPADIPEPEPNASEATISLAYHHYRAGTLPLSTKTEFLFPLSQHNPVLFDFVDGRTGNTFPGWVNTEGNYIFGLETWYQQNKLPVGAFIRLQKTDDPRRVVVDYEAIRSQRDWIRQANVLGKQLTFRMHTEAIGCQYDELMMVAVADQSELDELWFKHYENPRPLTNIIQYVFPELSKLNPQSTVNTKTLYTAINILRRTPPGPLIEVLIKHPDFIPMKNGYWSYEP